MSSQSEGQVLELPAYRAVLSVDVKNFSGVKPADHHEWTEKIPLVLERAFHRAGHATAWDERRFPAGRGDGYVVGFRPELLPILVGPFLDSLQSELAYHHEMRTGSSPSGPRMRVSIAVGPLTDSDEGRLGDGSGASMIETHRLLDSEPVRRVLEESDPDVTFVAAIISARVYEDVVLSGYSATAPTEFVGVPVEVKTYSGNAFLRVPKLSGGLLERGLAVPGEQPAAAPGSEPVPQPISDGVANTVNGNVSGNVAQYRDYYHQGGDIFRGDIGQHVSGDGNLLIGRNVSGGVRHKARKAKGDKGEAGER
jgi:hypothetical protein